MHKIEALTILEGSLDNYRRLAMQCHPDRGGSVHEMMLLNAAREELLTTKSKIDWSGLQQAFKLESKFQTAIVKTFRSAGAEIFNVHGGTMQQSGWPDIQVYHPIWTGQLELKIHPNTASKLQLDRIRKLQRVKTFAYVCTYHEGRIKIGESYYKYSRKTDSFSLLRWLSNLTSMQPERKFESH